MSELSLKDKTIRGVGWSAADTFLGKGITFLVGLVLARLLSPDEYGLIGIVTIFTTVLLGFVDCGFSSALIRKQKVSNDDYNTMFIVNLVVSVAMYALLFAATPLIADFFERPQLVHLIRVTGLLLIIQALTIVQGTILSRNLDFKTKAKASVFSAAASGAVGVAMAFAGCGVWSLVAQQLTRQFICSVYLWCYNRWIPCFSFRLESLRYMWGFGWKLMLSGFLDRFWAQLNQVVVGKFYSPATLGQYSRSKEFANIFSSNLTSVVQRVSYPVLSQVQDDKARLTNGYRRIIKTTIFVSAVTMISMGAVAEPLIYCLIGPKWHEAATYLPLICLNMSLYPLHAINLNMLQVQGRSDIFLILEIIKKILAIGPLCLGIFVSVYWMLIGSLFFSVIVFFLNSFFSGRMLGYSSWRQLCDVAPSYGVAIAMALSVFFLKYLPLSFWLILPIQIVVGTSCFFLICESFKMPEYLEVKSIAKEYVGKIGQIMGSNSKHRNPSE